MEHAENAAKGASLLDSVEPGWFRRIDVDTLNLRDTAECILGQAFGGYINGLGALAARTNLYWQGDRNIQVEHGFDMEERIYFLSTTAYCDESDELTSAWVGEIDKRMQED